MFFNIIGSNFGEMRYNSHMNYLNFHRLCLYTMAEMYPGYFKDTDMVLKSGTQLRVKNISTSCIALLRYYCKYNNLEWNGVNPHGIVIDRFVREHEVERRYAPEPAPEIKELLKNFPKACSNAQLMEKINKMHKDKVITHNDFNAQGGSKYEFTYKFFKEIYTLLNEEGLV
jgi:hypothetical protein